MGLFSSRSYRAGGEHHVRITDPAFDEALRRIVSGESLDPYRAFARSHDCFKHEAFDFPVTRIIGTFFLSYDLQAAADGVPEPLGVEKVQLAWKDQADFRRFTERLKTEPGPGEPFRAEGADRKGWGGRLVELAVQAAARGLAGAATGKTEEVRWFEWAFADYLCGRSRRARDYLVNYAIYFGGRDAGLLDVAGAIREQFWVAEFVRYQRLG